MAVAGEVCGGLGGEGHSPARALAEGPELVLLMGADPDDITLDDDLGECPARTA